MAGDIESTHRALTELLAPGGDLHSAPEILGTYFDDAAIVRTAHLYMARQKDIVQDGRAVVVCAGPPAAGKSTVLAGLGLSGYRLIDPDAAKDLLLSDAQAHGLLDYRDGITLPDGGPVKVRELAAHVHPASTRVADIVRTLAMGAGENIIIDGTLRWAPLGQQYVDELFSRGYTGLDVVDVELPMEVALRRARQRWCAARARHGGSSRNKEQSLSIGGGSDARVDSGHKPASAHRTAAAPRRNESHDHGSQRRNAHPGVAHCRQPRDDPGARRAREQPQGRQR